MVSDEKVQKGDAAKSSRSGIHGSEKSNRRFIAPSERKKVNQDCITKADAPSRRTRVAQ